MKIYETAYKNVKDIKITEKSCMFSDFLKIQQSM